MRFRKKPVEVEAELFVPQQAPPAGVTLRADGRAVILTLEGEMTVSPGDWVITGVAGERYPCKPDIFAATYEAVK